MSSKEIKLDSQAELNLSLSHLTQVKKQLDQELNLYQDSITTLKVAQTKYSDSKESLEKITADTKGSKILVPLTGSMFVPGKIADPDKVLVDIGTGYYVHMDMLSATDYFKRRIAYVTEQMEKIQNIGIEKNKMREAIMGVMERKIQVQMAAQQAQIAKT